MTKRHSLTEPQSQTKWLSAIVGILLSLMVIMLWWSRHNQIQEDQRILLTSEAQNLSSYLTVDINNRISAFQRMRDRWETRGGTSKEEFTRDARNYILDLPGIQAVEWVDRNYIVRWIIPFVGNEKALGLNLASEEHRHKALEQARFRNAPTMTAPIDLVQGGKGFLIYFPLYVDKEFDGFILIVFRYEQWLNHVFEQQESREELENYRVSLQYGESVIFRQKDWHDGLQSTRPSTVVTNVLGHKYSVNCYPTPLFYERNRSWDNEVMATVGLLVSAMVAFVLNLFHKATREAWRAYSANVSLEEANKNLETTRNELQDIYSRLELATKAGNIGLWQWDIEEDTLTWNKIMYSLYGIPDDITPSYTAWKSAVHDDDIETTESLLKQAIDGKAKFDTEFTIVLPNGTEKEIRAAAHVQRDSKGNALGMTGANWDITEAKKAGDLLATERRRLADIIEGTNAGTWEWNIQTGETVFNQRWAEIIGYSLDELEPISIETWKEVTHPEDLINSTELLQKHFSGELDYYEIELRLRHKNGSWIWVLDRGKVTTWDEAGKPLLMSGTHQDITDRKLTEEKIHHLANHDPLTNLPTLRLAKDRTEMAINIAKRKKTLSALMFIDLDGFKAINDTFGHDAGDAILIHISKQLQTVIRKNDTIARIGGDEFLAIITELQAPINGAKIAEKIIETASQPYYFKENLLKVGASVGIAIYPQDGEDFDELIKKADTAMYEVKKAGKHGYAFSPDNNSVSCEVHHVFPDV